MVSLFAGRFAAPSAVVVVAFGLTACAPQMERRAEGGAAAPLDSSCPDDGPRLPISGVCQGRAVNYMAYDQLITDAPAGCEWRVEETAMPDDRVILYRGLSCDGRPTQLDFSGGAHSASMSIVSSAQGDPVGTEIVRIFGDGERNPALTLKGLLAQFSWDERERCEIRLAKMAGWPEDAIVIAPTAAARARMPQDEPVAACGDFGFDEDATSYWRYLGGYAFHFSLGQDLPEIDPASFVILPKRGQG